MACPPHVVIVDLPHHITQCGNARQAIFSSDSDRLAYLELLRALAHPFEHHRRLTRWGCPIPFSRSLRKGWAPQFRSTCRFAPELV